MNTQKIEHLTCCCCGEETKGRQWHNRDTGFGLCAQCAKWIREKETAEEMFSRYGHRSIHYDLPEVAHA